MKTPPWLLLSIPVVLALGGAAISAQDKYAVQVPGGLALSECRGYEDWAAVAVSDTEGKINAIVANPVMIEAYRAGIPGNGKAFPDGAKTVKLHWKREKSAEAPDPSTIVPGTLIGLGCMVRDSKRFADGGNWGYAQFDYDAASDTFAPNTSLQGNDAKCGFACHTIVKAKDYVFTAYPKR
ncbi:MAG TPA: cytochrome P460 family protein [Hyphomicrobiaceae bacterium]|jgi:Cytochrome P460|nr:cytochrome P460 family protein [Hyphomicrobiaceae bacterium]